MDKIETHTEVLDQIFAAKSTQQLAGMESVLPHSIIDRERKEYVLMWVGWSGDEYIHGVMFHVQLINSQIIIYKDNTDIDLKTLLQEYGVEQGDIVLESSRKELELYA